jgi:predicted PurR-regulated permease PerM
MYLRSLRLGYQPAFLTGTAQISCAGPGQQGLNSFKPRLMSKGGFDMNADQQDKAYLERAFEVAIHIGLFALLAVACLLILSPFIALIVWGLIIAISGYPGFSRLQKLVGGRAGLASVLFSLLLLAVVVVPIVLLAETLADGFRTLAVRLHDGTLTIPPPPPKIANWPILGKELDDLWGLASNNLSAALQRLAPQLKLAANGLFSAAATVGFGVLQFFASILVAGVFLAYSSGSARVSRSFAIRLFGSKGAEFEALAVATIRSVTTGILGVALAQSLLAGIGFLVVGLPGAGLWAFLFMIAAVLQVGALVLIPVVIYVFATATTAKAVAFLIWCIFVALLDNVLKPLLLGRGVPVPIIVVFLGAIGGFLAIGIIGLFIGPIVLSVGYKLFLAWLDQSAERVATERVDETALTSIPPNRP